MNKIETEESMKSILFFLIGVFIVTTLVSCETIKGVGKDIQNTGQNIGDVLSGNTGSGS